MNSTYLLNSAWMMKCRSEAKAFERAADCVAKTQAALLRDMLRRNADTEFGRNHGFDRVATPQEFQRRVPLATYDNFANPINRIAAGAPNLLTSDPVTLLEPTSGTSRGEKLIPYTSSLRRQFQRMASAWIYDLFSRRPAVRGGRAYWSISPATMHRRRTQCGIPIGFDDDTAYLGGIERRLMHRLLAVPGSVAKLTDVAEFRYATLVHLIQARDLTLISIWSPTFLEALLTPLEAFRDRLAYDVQTSDAELAAILRADLPPQEMLAQIWPRLALVSCWADGAAARYVGRIRELLPEVEIQPKGLLATEGCVSFPLIGHDGAALALRSHFFEFQEVDAAEEEAAACRLAQELRLGDRYRVVLTTGGGLYRYRLGDVVEVVGFHRQCPLLRFQGRSGAVSDRVGEKLDEAFVAPVVDRVLSSHGITPRFALLAPEDPTELETALVENDTKPRRAAPRYRLFVQPAGAFPDHATVRSLQEMLEAALEENPHYRHAVLIEQLAPVAVTILDPGGASAWSIYERRRLAQGLKAGDIKPTSLDAWTAWSGEFQSLTRRHALASGFVL
jgi:hypothetical protein